MAKQPPLNVSKDFKYPLVNPTMEYVSIEEERVKLAKLGYSIVRTADISILAHELRYNPQEITSSYLDIITVLGHETAKTVLDAVKHRIKVVHNSDTHVIRASLTIIKDESNGR